MGKKTTILECVIDVWGRWASRRLFWSVQLTFKIDGQEDDNSGMCN